MAKLFSVSGFYKADHPDEGGFSVNIFDNPDDFNEFLDETYQRFLTLGLEMQQQYIKGTVADLSGAKAIVAGKEAQRILGSTTGAVIRGLVAIFILEKQGLLTSDEFNGMLFTTTAEVEAFKAMSQLSQGLHMLRYGHDDNCLRLSQGHCNCVPDVTLESQ